MKPGMSSLNPYAESYVPLSKREPNIDKQSSTMPKKNTIKNDSTCSSSSGGNNDPKLSSLQPYGSVDFNICGIEELLTGEDSRKGQPSLSDNTDRQYIDDGFEMDVAYLTTLYPSVSEQSLAGVYSANGGDMDASVEMLSQLELYPVDVSKHLPETLDIGDVSESKPSASGSSMKLKSIDSGEASSSSSDLQQKRGHGI